MAMTRMLLGLQSAAPVGVGEAGEVGVGDGIAAPCPAHLDEQPAADLRRGGEHRLVAVAGGDRRTGTQPLITPSVANRLSTAIRDSFVEVAVECGAGERRR